MVRNEYVANMYKFTVVFRILNKVYIFTDNLYCMVLSVNQHLLGRGNFDIKVRPGAHNPQRVTAINSCNGVFTSEFIFR